MAVNKEHTNPELLGLILQGYNWLYVVLIGIASWLGKKLYESAITEKFADFDDRLENIETMIIEVRETLAYMKGTQKK